MCVCNCKWSCFYFKILYSETSLVKKKLFYDLFCVEEVTINLLMFSVYLKAGVWCWCGVTPVKKNTGVFFSAPVFWNTEKKFCTGTGVFPHRAWCFFQHRCFSAPGLVFFPAPVFFRTAATSTSTGATSTSTDRPDFYFFLAGFSGDYYKLLTVWVLYKLKQMRFWCVMKIKK